MTCINENSHITEAQSSYLRLMLQAYRWFIVWLIIRPRILNKHVLPKRPLLLKKYITLYPRGSSFLHRTRQTARELLLPQEPRGTGKCWTAYRYVRYMKLHCEAVLEKTAAIEAQASLARQQDNAQYVLPSDKCLSRQDSSGRLHEAQVLSEGRSTVLSRSLDW